MIKNKSHIIFYIILVALISGMLYFTFSTVKQNQELAMELDRLSTELIDTTNMLSETKDALTYETDRADKLQNELVNVTDALDSANSIIDAIDSEAYIFDLKVTDAEIDMLAKTVWGEARGCDKLGQSAVVWCVLNRVDAGGGTIAQVITAKNQFHGYNKNFPVDEEIRALVLDVVARWKLEKVVCGEVGRTLPSEFLYFSSDASGLGNVFRTSWTGDYIVWNWLCWNPYE